MDTSVIVGAIIAGATIALKETAAKAVKDAYEGLKSILVGQFKIGSISTLEKAPSDEVFRQSVAKEIDLNQELVSDPEIKNKIDDLFAAIKENQTDELLAEVGIDVGKIEAGGDAVFREISGFKTAIKADSISAENDAVFENISGKPTT